MGTSEWKPNRARPNESVSSIIHVFVRIQRKHRCPAEGTTLGGDRNLALDAGDRRPRGRHGQPELGPAEQLVDRFASRQRPRLFDNDRHALATLFQVVLPVACAMNISDLQHAQQGGEGFVASGLTLAHGFDGQRVWKRARRVQLQPVVEEKQANLRVSDRVVAMYGGVDHRLEHRSRTELRHVHPPRRLVCRDSRVALGEVDGVADLPVQRSGDRRGIVLTLARLPQLSHDFDDFSSFDSRSSLISLSPIFVTPL